MNKSIITLALFTSLSSLFSHLTIEDLVRLEYGTLENIEKAVTYLDRVAFFEEKDWNGYHQVVQKLIRQCAAKNAVEIGVSTGLNSYKVLKYTDVDSLYSIDPYISYGDPTNLNLSQNTFDIMYLRLLDMLSEFGSRAHILRMMSADASPYFADNSLEFIFLDANHTYEHVKQDLSLWYPKLKPGFIIAGDDYATVHPGVPQAVNEFFKALSIVVHQDETEPRIWWIQKP